MFLLENLNEALVIEVNASSPNLAAMESCINELLDGQPEIMWLEKLRKLFNIEFRPLLCTKITIVDTDEKEFFGARVMPDNKYLEEIVKQGLNPKSEPYHIIFKEYNIEIDKKLLEQGHLDGREVLAILLHEIGHTASDAKLFCPRALMNDVKLRAPMLAINTAFSIGAGNIYLAGGGLLVATLLSLYDHGMDYWRNLKNERNADSMAFKCGYGVDLVNALDKLIMLNQTLATNAKSPDTRKMIKFSLSQMVHLRQRQNQILRMFKAQLKEEQSPAARDVLQKQISALEAGKKDRKVFMPTKKLGEQAQFEAELNESIRSFMEMQIKGLSRLEVDEIEVEIGRIETSEDKLYVVQSIHKAISIANKAKQRLANSNKLTDKARVDEINDYIKDLQALVPKAKAVKTIIYPYNIVVKYPKGDYEEEEVCGD